jgi:T-complex protein 1 subunit alpha
MEGEETFDASFLGHADEVVEERIADDDVILVKGTKNTSAVCKFSIPILSKFAIRL